ncbi:8970_t:CDS:1 [Gigaspora rosea]|nr:8967_t:CDS:1 [Gigaspora rosea]CAG8498023.1 8970_t:CDS:1 [Gigaspora rosea]
MSSSDTSVYKFVVVDKNIAKRAVIKEKPLKQIKQTVTMTTPKTLSSDGKQPTEVTKTEIVQNNTNGTVKKEDQEPETKPREKPEKTSNDFPNSDNEDEKSKNEQKKRLSLNLDKFLRHDDNKYKSFNNNDITDMFLPEVNNRKAISNDFPNSDNEDEKSKNKQKKRLSLNLSEK